jgi:hypothetical protein
VHGRWPDVSQDHVQWQALALVGLKFRVIIIQLVNKFKINDKSTTL